MSAHKNDRQVAGWMLAAFGLAIVYLVIESTDCATRLAFIEGSLAFELVRGLPAFLVAVAVAIISWRQAAIAKAKLKLELFERRLKVFEATWQLLSKPIQDGDQKLNPPEFTNLLPEAEFLFGSEIRKYMELALQQRALLWLLEQRARRDDPQGPDFAKAAKVREWLFAEASSGCRATFAPYLDFSSWSS